MAREGTVLGGFTLGPVVHRGGMPPRCTTRRRIRTMRAPSS
jgi:hypothetical protein